MSKYKLLHLNKNYVKCGFVGLFTIVSMLACHQDPTVGRAANPDLANKNMHVMGGTSNQNLQNSIAILKDFLDKKLQTDKVDSRINKDFSYIPEDQRSVELRTLMGYLKNYKDLVLKPQAVDLQKKKMIIAQFYYEEHRYLPAAELFTEILDKQTDYPEARNLLARCFFFLGNTDKAISELKIRMKQIENKSKNPKDLKSSDSNEYIDALYVIGGAVNEDSRPTKKKIKEGLKAWQAYLQLAPTSPQKAQIEAGIQDFEDRLSGKTPLTGKTTVKTPQGKSSSAGASGPNAKKGFRVAELKADASDLDKALAQALDAFDERDTMTAMTALKKAEKIDAENPTVMTSLARVQTLLGNYPKALELYTIILKKHPTFMPAWHYQGMTFMMSQKPAQAAKSWRHIEKVDPTYFANANLSRRAAVAESMANR